MAFMSIASTNLTPDWLGAPAGSPSIAQAYVRDLASGQVTLVSRASGAGAAGNADSFFPKLSSDGRYVVFVSYASNLTPDDSQGHDQVYLRDLQTNTTTLVSRATGPAGNPGNGNSYEAFTSPDGRYVGFYGDSTNLDPDDTDVFRDVYVRDTQTDTTLLVSRASGASGPKADWGGSGGGSISGNGRVVFGSAGDNLDPDDTDRLDDVFVRDLATSTTTLVSRATGAAGAKGNANSGISRISADGRTVAFQSNASNLTPEGAGAAGNIFVRDLQTNTTTLASRATGATGAPGTAWAAVTGISGDGRYVVFFTAGSLDPADGETGTLAYDIYLRDLQTNTTTLVSRATGPSGAKGNDESTYPSISGDGGLIAFQSEATNFAADDHDGINDSYVRDMQTFVTSLEGRATPGYFRYVRPKGATPFRASLVPASQPCTAPNRTHGAPLAFGSCAPPVSASPNLTVGVGDGSPALARSVGSLLMKATASDISIVFSLTNVMHGGDLTDYTGELQGRIAVRMTDKRNGPSAAEEGTVQDFDLAFTIPCAATTSTLDGAKCSVSTTAGSVIPGLTTAGARAIYGLDQARVYDGGPDEDAETTADNSLFAVQGIFIP
jgi:Tol biopolymer transport system component